LESSQGALCDGTNYSIHPFSGSELFSKNIKHVIKELMVLSENHILSETALNGLSNRCSTSQSFDVFQDNLSNKPMNF
jgi:hypothetical protein